MAIQPGRCILYQLRIRRPGQGKGDSGYMCPILFALDGENIGEASPNTTDETIHKTRQILTGMLERFAGADCADPRELARQLHEAYPMNPAARTAMEMIFYDRASRSSAAPLHEYLKLRSPEAVANSWPIVLGSEAVMAENLAQAGEAASLTVKCSGKADQDLRWIQWLGRQTGKALRINAHGEWNYGEARMIIRALAELRVEYLEQPLPSHHLEETDRLACNSPVPILLDNDAWSSADLEHIAGHCHGFTIRLMKSGGFTESLRMIARGREMGMLIALNTSLKSTAGITAAAHLAGMVDFVNLIGPLAIDNDPIDGLRVDGGKIKMPGLPGLGIRIKEEYLEYFPR